MITTPKTRPRFAVAATMLIAFLALPAFSQSPAPPQVDADDQLAIIHDIAGALDRVYIFPEVAKKMGDRMRGNHQTGAYSELTALPAFCQQLTEDLQAISKDLHLRVSFAPPPPPGATGKRPSLAVMRDRRQQANRRDNFCFRKAEHLSGNVGYLKFDCFMDATIAGDTAISAINFLSNSDALIVDLRQNGGGSPSMIQLISSYFFEERKHLNSFYVRETDHTEEFWTQASVKGKRMVDVPIYVLTSARTFSAAEEFTYNLKNMERATIIGQTTGGGAHPVRTYEVTDYPVRVSLPFGRAINPITGTNWEGTGIEPDIRVPSNQALETAHHEALKTLEASANDDITRRTLAIARLQLETELHPVALTADALRAFVGSYGPRSITLEGSKLFYSRGGRSPSAMIAAGEDRFFIDDNQGFYFHFERNASGKIVRIVGNYSNGQSDQHERTGN